MTKRKKKTKKKTRILRILSKTLQFSRQQQVQKIKLFEYYTEKEKKWTELLSLGQYSNLKLHFLRDCYKSY